MTGVVATVPIACWRRPHAREYLETFLVPPPSTCYGFLLALVGEEDRHRHEGVRLSMACSDGAVSTVLRTVWRVKDKKSPPGSGSNARPDFQELVTERTVAMLLDSSDEHRDAPTLETRVQSALSEPQLISRFGGLSMGESTHLVNDLHRNDEPAGFTFFHADPTGEATFPVWVDHVGASRTTYITGSWSSRPPRREEMVLVTSRGFVMNRS